MRKLLLLALLFLTVPVWAQAPAFRAANSGNEGFGTSVTVTKPTGTAADDILEFEVHRRIVAAITWPSGFVEKSTIDVGGRSMAVAWKRAGGSEPADYTAEWTGFAQADAILSAFSGAITTGDPHDPVAFTTITGAGNDNSVVLPSITTTAADVLVVGYGSWDGASRLGSSTDLTERHENNAGTDTAWVGDVSQAGSGASGDKTINLSSSGPNRMGMLSGLKPPAGAAVTRRRAVIY